MTNTIKLVLATAAVAVLAGCPGNNLPGGTNVPGAPAAFKTADPAMANACTNATPAGTTTTGLPAHGRYNGKRMPAGWATDLSDEAKVTAAIDSAQGRGGNEWNCFHKFYPDLLNTYFELKGARVS